MFVVAAPSGRRRPLCPRLQPRRPPAANTVPIPTIAVTLHRNLSPMQERIHSYPAIVSINGRQRRHSRGGHVLTHLVVKVCVVAVFFAVRPVPRQRNHGVLLTVQRADARGAGGVWIAVLVVGVGTVRLLARSGQEVVRIEEVDPRRTL